MNVSFLLRGQAHPVLEPKSWALPVLTLHFPSLGAVAEVKSNLNSAMLQHRRTEASYQKLRDAASDGKLRPQATFPQ